MRLYLSLNLTNNCVSFLNSAFLLQYFRVRLGEKLFSLFIKNRSEVSSRFTMPSSDGSVRFGLHSERVGYQVFSLRVINV